MSASKAATSSATRAVRRKRNFSDSSRTDFISDSTDSCPFLPIVTLQTMDTSAAPMAPMMAAALPPPGVGLPLARSSKKVSRELSVIMKSANHGLGDGVNLFGIQQRIVLFE